MKCSLGIKEGKTIGFRLPVILVSRANLRSRCPGITDVEAGVRRITRIFRTAVRIFRHAWYKCAGFSHFTWVHGVLYHLAIDFDELGGYLSAIPCPS